MRIARLLSMDRGSALLVGVGGSGKQSLSRLAAYIRGAYTFQITITKTYNVTNLFEDIKGLYKIAAVKGQPVVFIFTDAEVKDEGFLEYINQILMTGEVAGMMPKDELDALVGDMRPIMKAAIQRGEVPAQPDTYENLYSFYLNRVRDNLHLVLCFSPVGAKFSRRAMQFPGLINGCTIDWFLPWPEEALTSVSGKFIQNFDMACDAPVKASLKLVMGHVHSFVTAACQEYFEKFRRHTYVTPKSFLSFIQFYMSLYKVKWERVAALATAINAGLEKMDEAKVDVGRMKQNLAVKNQELAKASKEAEQLLKSISESTAIAEKEKAKVAVIVDSVSTKAAEIAGVKADAERDLAAAQPALDAVRASTESCTDLCRSERGCAHAVRCACAGSQSAQLDHAQGHWRAEGAQKPSRHRQAYLRLRAAPALLPPRQAAVAGGQGRQRAHGRVRDVRQDDVRLGLPQPPHELPEGADQRRDGGAAQAVLCRARLQL